MIASETVHRGASGTRRGAGMRSLARKVTGMSDSDAVDGPNEPNRTMPKGEKAPKWPPRISAAAAMLGLVLTGASAVLAWAAVTLSQWQTDKAFPVTTALSVDQLCMNWATYVERLDGHGLKPREINVRGRWFSNAAATSSDFGVSITELCGTAEGILHQVGRAPTTTP
jgi:hypothetical protein